MALGAGNMKSATLLEQLLEEINFQRTKEMRQLLKDGESGFVVLQGTTYWTDLFVRHFLFQEEQAIDCDDLLFFVRKRHVRGSSRRLPKYETEVEVFRKDSKKLPIGDPEVDWEETVYLNLVVHRFEYTLTLATCTRTSPRQLQVLRRHSQQVYASPSRRKMDTKGDGEEMTYPHICFMVDNFDEVFCDIVVRDGEMVCVELVARGRGAAPQAVVFLGSVRYDALSRVYDTRQTSLSTKMALRMSFGWLGSAGSAASRCEFVRLRGPGGRGRAELAVSKPRGAGADTPCSEPGTACTDLWDSDCEDDVEDLFVYRHERRLSDPSSNLHMYSRGGWRTRGGGAGAGAAGAAEAAPGAVGVGAGAVGAARSEAEDLDSLVAGIAEVEAGDLRDAASSDTMGAVVARRGAAGPESLRRAPAPRAPPPPPPELADDALAAPAPAAPAPAPAGPAEGARREVRGREERAARRGRVPSRTAPDGTEVFYWCDLPAAELDAGAYHPVWTSRGFSQTYALWKEGRRQQSAPLAAYLTSVTLPWWSIAKDILDHCEDPILTF